MAGRGRGRKVIEKTNLRLETLTIEYLASSEITPNTYNPNRQSEHDFELLCKSMREDGFTQPIIVQRMAQIPKMGESHALDLEDEDHVPPEAGPLHIVMVRLDPKDLDSFSHRLAGLVEDQRLGTLEQGPPVGVIVVIMGDEDNIGLSIGNR